MVEDGAVVCPPIRFSFSIAFIFFYSREEVQLYLTSTAALGSCCEKNIRVKKIVTMTTKEEEKGELSAIGCYTPVCALTYCGRLHLGYVSFQVYVFCKF